MPSSLDVLGTELARAHVPITIFVLVRWAAFKLLLALGRLYSPARTKSILHSASVCKLWLYRTLLIATVVMAVASTAVTSDMCQGKNPRLMGSYAALALVSILVDMRLGNCLRAAISCLAVYEQSSLVVHSSLVHVLNAQQRFLSMDAVALVSALAHSAQCGPQRSNATLVVFCTTHMFAAMVSQVWRCVRQSPQGYLKLE